MDLRLTRRALEDLGLDPAEYSRRSARDYAGAHDVVRAFIERRGQSPVGQETTRLPVSSQVVYNLHAGRWRGLTWHDEDADVVWLLGVGCHRSGERDDAYEVLKRRDEAGDLLPDEQDYLDLEASIDEALEFVEAVAQEGPALLERAREKPCERITAVIAGASTSPSWSSHHSGRRRRTRSLTLADTHPRSARSSGRVGSPGVLKVTATGATAVRSLRVGCHRAERK